MGRRKVELKLKEPVRIRERKLKDGNISLYLDTYYKGARKKESLQLFIIPEVTPTAKQQNINTRKLAEQIKAQRILEIQKNGIVSIDNIKNGHRTLVSWFQVYIDQASEEKLSSRRSRVNTLARIEAYTKQIAKPDIMVTEVDKKFCKGFIEYLETCTYNNGKKKLATTTQRIFVNSLTAALNLAVREGLIDRNPMSLLDPNEKPQKRCTEREFLTIDELKLLMATPCRYEIVKKAFLFSCFTGLRYSDMSTLKWSEIHDAADGKTRYIEHKQVKTKNTVVIPLSEEAIKWMPEQIDGIDTIFNELKITSTTVEVVLDEWVKAAGISKHITYHCSRHTAATLLLTLGANLYVVSKILGHRSIKMTEIYAKIVDKTKIETVSLVNNMFNDTPKAV